MESSTTQTPAAPGNIDDIIFDWSSLGLSDQQIALGELADALVLVGYNALFLQSISYDLSMRKFAARLNAHACRHAYVAFKTIVNQRKQTL